MGNNKSGETGEKKSYIKEGTSSQGKGFFLKRD